jgi:uncharacterized membrane protein YjjP (DUF1212 family)
LMESGQIKEYSKKYRSWILSFFLLWIVAVTACILRGVWRLIPIIVLGILLILILVKTIQRTLKEKYLSHLFYVPMVISIRGVWYIYMEFLSF